MPQFFQTPMGRTFFDVTLPKLVAQVSRLADAAERIAAGLEAVAGARTEAADHANGKDKA